MPQNLSRSSGITYLIILSFFGLFLAGMLTVYPPRMLENLLWRKPLIGSIFGLICVFGILAVFFPTQCSRVFDFGKEEKPSRFYLGKFASHGTSSTLQGHHPNCENFAAHVFRIGDRTFCVACTGLLLGGFSALVGTLLYFFSNWSVEPSSSLMVWAGVLGVGFGLFQFKFRSFVRLFLNIFFVLGTFFILTGVDKLVQSVTVDLFLVALTLFWLFTRISLSQWDHERICYTCKVATCEFADRKKEGRLGSTAEAVEGSGND
jgi:ABC-type multidrug transport system fused ATPase/permease subunit